MGLVLLRESAPYIAISLANVIIKSLKSGVFEQDWKNARVTPIYKDDGDIIDENNYRPIYVIDHIAKDDRIPCELSNYWCFWKSIVLCQWINLPIRKDTPPKLAFIAWWRHQMETFSALLAICAGNSPVPGEFPTQRLVTRSFDVYFDLRPNKWLSKQSWGWWFETLACSLWRHRNGVIDNWLENVNACAITGGCLLDILKCFDSTNHTIRLKKLEMYGITNIELKWFSSYIRGRKQVVKFHQDITVILHVAFHRGRFQAQFCSYYLSMISLTSL